LLDLDLKERQLFENERISTDMSNQIKQLQLQLEEGICSSKSLMDKNKDLIEKWGKAKDSLEQKTNETYLLQVVLIFNFEKDELSESKDSLAKALEEISYLDSVKYYVNLRDRKIPRRVLLYLNRRNYARIYVPEKRVSK
jgi:hypothetical protein